MGWISRLFGKKQLTTYNSSYINSSTAIYPDWNYLRNYDWFTKIDEIFSVISFLSETAAQIPFYGYDVVSDKALKKYERAEGLRQKYFQIKALEDISENDKLQMFLDSIDYETKALWYTHFLIVGELFLYKDIIEVGPNAGMIRPHVLNSENITIKLSETFPQEVTGYIYLDAGFSGTLNTDEVIHIKYPNPNPRNGANWRGISPLRIMTRRITRMEAGMDASVSQMQNGGVPGIIYEKDATDIETIGQRKNDFQNYLRNKNNKGAPYFTGGELGYIAMGLKLADLEVSELAKVDFTALCNAYKVPEQLLNNHESSTDNNMEAAEKRLYTNSITPLLMRFRDCINKDVVPYINKGRKQYVDFDLSKIAVLQEDVKQQTEALKLAEWVTLNEKREMQGYDRIENPMMDQIIISQGQQLLDDLEIMPDVE